MLTTFPGITTATDKEDKYFICMVIECQCIASGWQYPGDS